MNWVAKVWLTSLIDSVFSCHSCFVRIFILFLDLYRGLRPEYLSLSVHFTILSKIIYWFLKLHVDGKLVIAASWLMVFSPLGCHVHYLEQSTLASGFGKLSCIFTSILTINLFCMSMACLPILPLHSIFSFLSSFLHCIGDHTMLTYMPSNVSQFDCLLLWNG